MYANAGAVAALREITNPASRWSSPGLHDLLTYYIIHYCTCDGSRYEFPFIIPPTPTFSHCAEMQYVHWGNDTHRCAQRARDLSAALEEHHVAFVHDGDYHMVYRGVRFRLWDLQSIWTVTYSAFHELHIYGRYGNNEFVVLHIQLSEIQYYHKCAIADGTYYVNIPPVTNTKLTRQSNQSWKYLPTHISENRQWIRDADTYYNIHEPTTRAHIPPGTHPFYHNGIMHTMTSHGLWMRRIAGYTEYLVGPDMWM